MTSEQLAITQVVLQTVHQLSKVITQAEQKGLEIHDHLARNYALCGVLLNNRMDSPLTQLLWSRLGEEFEFHIGSRWLYLLDETRIPLPCIVTDIEDAWNANCLEEVLSEPLAIQLGIFKSVAAR